MSYIDPRFHRAMVRVSKTFDDLHPHGHQCDRCEPPVPSLPGRLTAGDIGKLTTAGIAIPSAILLVVDPHGYLVALAGFVGLQL